MNDDGQAKTNLVLSVDGSYTNETVMTELPANVDFFGRIRKDPKPYHLPEPSTGQRGRKRITDLNFRLQYKAHRIKH